MQVYKVEIFDDDFRCVYHSVVGDVTYEEDYISPVKNDVAVEYDENVKKNNYIFISSVSESYFGRINAITYDNTTMTITYKPFNTVFDTSILFDTDLQGTGSLETVLKSIIENNFINNADELQNISAIGDISIKSRTTNWGFNLKSDKEGMHNCIINLYNVIFVNSFSEYGVVVTATPNLTKKKIDLSIGTVDSNTFTIESDLNNILDKNIVIRESSNDTNKAVFYNDSNYNESISYYLHPNGSYDTVNDDRISPVVYVTKSVSVSDDSTFEKSANTAANELFGGIDYKNLVELSVVSDDVLIKPKEMKIGQAVNVIHNGISYNSIYSGFSIGKGIVEMTFGTVRLELSKIIKGGI